MNLNRITLSAAIAACFIPSFAFAQQAQNTSELDTISVTASRIAQPTKKLIGDVTVLSHEELQKQGNRSMAEVLAQQGQVQMYSNGGPQSVTGVFIRGASPQQTRVMLNGIRINETTVGATYWGAIDPAVLSQVEIVRGSASSLYGSDALGGVVNMLTYQPGRKDGMSTFANVGYGSYNTFKTSTGISGASNGFDYSFAAGYAHSRGINATNTDSFNYNGDKDGYQQYNIAGSVGYEWAPGQYIGTTFFNGQNRGDFDSGTSQGQDTTLGYTRQQVYGITSKNRISDFWTSNLTFGYSNSSNDSRTSYGNSIYGESQRQYSWQNDFTLTPEQSLSLVLEHTNESAQGQNVYTRAKRYTNAAGLIYRGNFGANHVQASVRNDNYTDYGNKVTGSLGYDYDINDNLSVGLAGNTGFRAPTFTDLYYPLSFGFQGNPNLKPESSTNVDAHIKYRNDNTELGLSVFNTRYHNLINPYVCDANYNCTTTNTNKANIKGLSLNGKYTWNNTKLSAGIDLLDPKDNVTDTQLVRRSKQVYRLGVEQEFAGVTLGANYQFNSRSFDDSANLKSLGGYGLINLKAAYDINKNVGIQAYWNNATGKKYTTAYGYNTMGSNVFVNLSLKTN